MANLTDYLDTASLQHLQDVLALAAGAQLRIYDAAGHPVTAPTDLATVQSAEESPAQIESREASIVVGGQTLGRVVLERPGEERWSAGRISALATALDVPSDRLRLALQQVHERNAETRRLTLRAMTLLAGVIRRLCRQEGQLRARIEELTTLHKLTALFAGHTDLPHVLDTVVKTVVAVVGVKAAGLRLLNAETKELTIEAVANLSREYLDKGKILLNKSVLDTQAFETGDVVYVPDHRTDPRVMFSAESRREGIVSALIAPLMYKGRPVGALRLYTAERRTFSRFDIALVKAIAAQASAAIVSAQMHVENLAGEALRRQLRLAGAVQRRMIPARPPQLDRLDLAAVYLPSLALSGDFYDFIELPRDNLGLAICDVMGKGMPAGLLMASVRASLRAHAGHLYDLSEILRRVNRSLCDDTLTMAFATLFYGVVNMRSMELTYTNASHEPPLLFRGDCVQSLGSDATALGVDRDLQYARAVVQLHQGDVLVFMTDGLIEAMNFQDEQFGPQRVLTAATAAIHRGEDANGVAQHILWEMRRFAGLRERNDDVTMIVGKVR